MKCYMFVVFIVLFTAIPATVKCVSGVPAFLWNIKGDALHIKPVSAFEVSTKKYMDNFLKESLSEKSTAILVFLTDELSLEDFSHASTSSAKDLQVLGEFLDTRPHMLLPHVRDPLKRLHSVHCEKEELYLDESTPQAVSSALDRSCVVFLHLPNSDATTGKTRIDIAKDILSSSSTSKKNVIGMFTAAKSSWNSPETQHKSRSLLAVDEQAVGYFYNFENCTIMYATNITVGNSSNPDVHIVNPSDYDLSESDCGLIENRFVLKFSNVTGYHSLTIRMVFLNNTGVWHLNQSDVSIGGEVENEDVEPSYNIEAPMGFSFSCGKLTFLTTNSTTEYAVTISGFQIQPFEIKKLAFADSFDCVTFFTLPIWMGLMVGILFIVILNTGVYALFAVKTMDRFDDPKGKTISVAFSAD